MRLPAPKAPPYDPREWQATPWSERWRLACQAWALDGYGAPPVIHGLYVVKVLLWVAAWAGFCSLNAGGGHDGDVGSWVFHPDAFKKAVLWSMAFEGLGLGCPCWRPSGAPWWRPRSRRSRSCRR